MLVVSPASLFGQQPTSPLTLIDAQAAARQVSPDLRAAREAVIAADARARQAGAFPNPTLAYSHERASRADATNAQHIAALEQPLDILGQRAARREAAELRAGVARAHLAVAEARLDFNVARAFAHVVAADRRATLASQASAAFGEARRVSRIRLTAGDVSGYADRRLQLEAARYAALASQTALARESARLVLATLTADSTTTLPASIAAVLDTRQVDTLVALLVADTVARPTAVAVAADSLQALALTRRAELWVAALERDVAAAEVRLAGRERIPVPVVTAGIKTETAAGVDGFRGLVAGVSVPLPLWDRRGGAIGAAEADVRRTDAELDALRRQISREVAVALAARQAVDEQLRALGPRVGLDTEAAMGAARVAYAEGEITLVEYLDAVRAYQEAEAAFADLQAEALVRRAALERAVGVPLP